ncbi:DUF4336 domain-containing protein [Nannocystaceae bacterium ST9]
MSELRRIAESLWVGESELSIAGMPLAIRMTVIRLPSGDLVLHSPIAIDDDLAARLEQLGPIRHVLAPNRLHHLHVRAAAERWPRAKLWAAPGLPDKRPKLRFDEVLGDVAPLEFEGVIETCLFAGAPLASEVVLYHRPSHTLIVTDLVFNVQRSTSSVSRLYWKAVGAWQRVAQTPVQRLMVRDRRAARVSLARMHAWPFERLIMAHGDIVERGAREAFASAVAKLAPGL